MTDTARTPLPWHGAAAVACWAIHAANHVLRGSAHDLLWVCNVAVPLLAVGCFVGRAVPVAIAISWLAFGTPIWLLDLAMGKAMIPTSPFVHIAAPVVAVTAVRRLGWPKRAMLAASGASIALVLLTRLVGSATTNVNLAFRVHDGWEHRFDSHAAFIGLLCVVAAIVFAIVDAVFARWGGPR